MEMVTMITYGRKIKSVKVGSDQIRWSCEIISKKKEKKMQNML